MTQPKALSREAMTRDEARVWMAEHPGEWLQVAQWPNNRVCMGSDGDICWRDGSRALLSDAFTFRIVQPALHELPTLSATHPITYCEQTWPDDLDMKGFAYSILTECLRSCRELLEAHKPPLPSPPSDGGKEGV